MPTFAAVDLGASSGRVVAGIVAGDDVRVEVAYRFPNGARTVDGHLRWDLTRLVGEVRRGLARLPDAVAVGIDAWGVDYGLLDGTECLLADPVSHRDDRTAAVIEDVHTRVPPDELYAINGLQHLPFTTIYQLAAEQRGPLWGRTERAVLIPDLVTHQLTGRLRTETTNASTTGLLDARTRSWSTEVLDRIGLPRDLFPALDAPGEVRGTTDGGIPVITVGSHDTASAVVGVPATTDRFAYVACGTWSLVGVELGAPVLTAAAQAANFTNEVGVDGRTRFLRNVGGLWLLQECMRDWGVDDLHGLLAAAAEERGGGPLLDVDDPALIPPGRMPERILEAVGDETLSAAAIVRCVLDSLAAAYARTIRQAAELADHHVQIVHLVGGGAENRLLCQLTADATGLPVIAGPVEAAALGNVVVQARACGLLPTSLEGIRARLARTTPLIRYDPT